MSINKETLKRTWLYIHCRKLFLWPIDFYRWYPKHLKWLLMAFQKNCMIDPCSRTRAKIWKLCGVDTTGKFNVGYDVYFDAQNAKHLHIEDGVWISSRCTILCHKRDLSNYHIPAWSIAIGRPARVIRILSPKDEVRQHGVGTINI